MSSRDTAPPAPAAVVQHAGLHHERQLLTQLGRLVTDVAAQGFGCPTNVLVGDVLRAHEGMHHAGASPSAVAA
jgi:siroheme synthase